MDPGIGKSDSGSSFDDSYISSSFNHSEFEIADSQKVSLELAMRAEFDARKEMEKILAEFTAESQELRRLRYERNMEFIQFQRSVKAEIVDMADRVEEMQKIMGDTSTAIERVNQRLARIEDAVQAKPTIEVSRSDESPIKPKEVASDATVVRESKNSDDHRQNEDLLGGSSSDSATDSLVDELEARLKRIGLNRVHS